MEKCNLATLYAQSGNPDYLGQFENVTIRSMAPENIDIGTKIMLLCQLDPK